MICKRRAIKKRMGSVVYNLTHTKLNGKMTSVTINWDYLNYLKERYGDK